MEYLFILSCHALGCSRVDAHHRSMKDRNRIPLRFPPRCRAAGPCPPLPPRLYRVRARLIPMMAQMALPVTVEPIQTIRTVPLPWHRRPIRRRRPPRPHPNWCHRPAPVRRPSPSYRGRMHTVGPVRWNPSVPVVLAMHTRMRTTVITTTAKRHPPHPSLCRVMLKCFNPYLLFYPPFPHPHIRGRIQPHPPLTLLYPTHRISAARTAMPALCSMFASLVTVF
jgi:hypothetical protein